MPLLALIKVEVKAIDADTIVDALYSVLRGLANQGYTDGKPDKFGDVSYTIIVRQTSEGP